MPRIAIVYHSGFGHTKRVAERIVRGAGSVDGVEAVLIATSELPTPEPGTPLAGRWPDLNQADAIVMGCPTYMGTVSAEFKRFMDVSGQIWGRRGWSGKLAAGFTNSGGLSGDKLNVLTTLAIFAAQHGMVWAPCDVPDSAGPGINRLGSYLGLMTQADNAPVEVTPPEEDLRTAELFGASVARATIKWAG